ncbi:MAG: hypothetical protein KatS3mg068_1714 [Candidatus Sericytochromatia bacterium]|nr:MAG: hypothetical protein KatS3mg068_1714 [Candidatus Sericytochromatia bacterium]
MDINSINQVQLESLDAIRNSNYQNFNNISDNDFSTTLESLDSIKSSSNNYYDTNIYIPPSQDLLAPIDYISPSIPQENYEDTRERGISGFVGGVFKGFGKAGIDTVKGVVTLAKVVGVGLTHPKESLQYVGAGIKNAIDNPGKTIKNIVIDLPVGIVKGIVKPYGDAIKQGKYGEATGRAIFDIGLILMTAGLGESSQTSKTGAVVEAIDSVSDTAKAIDKVSKTTKGVKTATEAASVVTKGSTVKLAEKAINISNVKGNVVINIGNTTANVTTTASKVSRATKTVKDITDGAKGVVGATEAIVATAETVQTAGKISLGLSDLGNLISKGAQRILKPIGNGLKSIIGEGTATQIGNGIANGVSKIKAGALFVKQHPIATGLITGKTIDIIDKGLKASDLYQPNYNY